MLAMLMLQQDYDAAFAWRFAGLPYYIGSFSRVSDRRLFAQINY